VVEAALRGLGHLASDAARRYLTKEAAKAADWQRRALLVRVFGGRGDAEAREALISALDDKVWQVRAAAIAGLARHKSIPAVDALVACFAKLDLAAAEGQRLAGDLRDALETLTGKSFATAAEWREFWAEKRDGFEFSTKERDPRTVVVSGTVERAPKLYDEILSKRVLLVIDTSGSMLIETGAEAKTEKPLGLSRWEVLRRELERVIGELSEATRFNIVAFADESISWKEKLVPATKASKSEAVRFVSKLRADGATNSYGALELAFKDTAADTIYFLSDGYPTAGKTIDFTKILEEVKRWNFTRNVKIHTIAFVAGDGRPRMIVEDKGQAKEFMKRLAAENGGQYRLVE
jgi:hypothetical protein